MININNNSCVSNTQNYPLFAKVQVWNLCEKHDLQGTKKILNEKLELKKELQNYFEPPSPKGEGFLLQHYS